jgi:hypothetical protein
MSNKTNGAFRKTALRDDAAYEKITGAFREARRGLTVADIVAKTALPLEKVRALVPAVSDEYRGRLEVTESGEIRYSFPNGFQSRYRGFRAGLRRFASAFKKGLGVAARTIFKVWTMVMLIGYFIIFMLIGLAALCLSFAGGSSSSSDSNSGGSNGGFFFTGIFDLIIRMWFYSELLDAATGTGRYNQQVRARRPRGRPLYKAVFSFVFGDGDPNLDTAEREKKAVLAYIQANKGVISLTEYMIITGDSPAQAEENILALCTQYNGSPESTDDGVIVYRFDELLLRADASTTVPGVPLKRLKKFSANTGKMNTGFCLVNIVNLLFGGYFFTNALTSGALEYVRVGFRQGREVVRLISQSTGEPASWLYGFTYQLCSIFTDNPASALKWGLGLVPLIFSVFFWVIPAVRWFLQKRDNQKLAFANFRKFALNKINADSPSPLTAETLVNLSTANKADAERLLKEFGAYSQPEVSADETGTVTYQFPELWREKKALAQYRAAIHPRGLGSTVFDSGA